MLVLANNDPIALACMYPDAMTSTFSQPCVCPEISAQHYRMWWDCWPLLPVALIWLCGWLGVQNQIFVYSHAASVFVLFSNEGSGCMPVWGIYYISACHREPWREAECFWCLSPLPRSGVLRMQKLRTPLVWTKGYQRFPLFKPGVGI